MSLECFEIRCSRECQTEKELIGHIASEHHFTKKAAKARLTEHRDYLAAELIKDTINALGLVSCYGCSAPINPESATILKDCAIGAHPFCGACFHQFKFGTVARSTTSGEWSYGFSAAMFPTSGDRFSMSTGYQTRESAINALRRHAGNNLSQPGNWFAGLNLIFDAADRADFIARLPWYIAAHKLGRGQTGLDDREFIQAELDARSTVAAAL